MYVPGRPPLVACVLHRVLSAPRSEVRVQCEHHRQSYTQSLTQSRYTFTYGTGCANILNKLQCEIFECAKSRCCLAKKSVTLRQ